MNFGKEMSANRRWRAGKNMMASTGDNRTTKKERTFDSAW